MNSDRNKAPDPYRTVRQFSGKPEAFWAALSAAVQAAVGARAVMIAARQLKEGTEVPWRVLARLVEGDRAEPFPSAMVRPLMEDAVVCGFAHAGAERSGGQWVAGQMNSGDSGQDCVLVCLLPDGSDSARIQAIAQLARAQDLPEFYLLQQRLAERERAVQKTVGAMDLLVRLRSIDRYEAAVLLVCNEVAQRLQSSQVALAWKTGDRFRIQGISHTPRFEGKMALVQALEQVAEEAADQGEDLLWPAVGGQSAVLRAHADYAAAQAVANLASICLWQGDAVAAVLVIQEIAVPVDDSLLRDLRVLADQIIEPLHHLHLRSGWLGKRIARAGRDWARRNWNLEHPWIKLSVVLGMLVCGILIFGGMTYRVEASFVMRTSEQRLLPAPNDGFLEGYFVRTGDRVEADQQLASLDCSEWLLQEVSLLADRNRYVSEAERARGRGELAEMRVALAQRDQTEASLSLVRSQLAAATIRAPFAAVVADDFGMPMRLGAPVQRGDVLVRLARMDELYLEIDLAERSIHEVRMHAGGEFAFASRPDLSFAFVVERIEPVGVPVEGGNIFRLHGAIASADHRDWWRPGMTGVVKITVGRRSFIWILTHRLIDWLRLQLWL